MDRLFPALDIEWPTPVDSERIEQLIAALDDEGPTAVEERSSGVAVFFPSDDRRDRALEIARAFAPEASVTAVSISDEAWAERSQASLTAIRVGRVVVTPPWARAGHGAVGRRHCHHDRAVDGVRHGPSRVHAPVPAAAAALASRRPVGARRRHRFGRAGHRGAGGWAPRASIGIDVDADALTSARENVELERCGRGGGTAERRSR